jgi:hypothetical protein
MRWASRAREELEQAIWRRLTRESGLAARDSGLALRNSESEIRNPGLRARDPGTAPTSSAESRSRSRNAYAFDLWIAHLALLEEALEVAPISWRELRADELDGLLLLRAARERFRREYHPCAECGAPVRGKICPRCGAVERQEKRHS